jgi:hypothetical protein
MPLIIFSSAALNAFVEGLVSAAEPEATGIPDIGNIGVFGFIGVGQPVVGADCAIAGLAMANSMAAA